MTQAGFGLTETGDRPRVQVLAGSYSGRKYPIEEVDGLRVKALEGWFKYLRRHPPPGAERMLSDQRAILKAIFSARDEEGAVGPDEV